MKPFPNANFNNLQEYVRSISGLAKNKIDLHRGAFPFITISMQRLLTEKFEKELIDYMSQMIAKTSPQIAVYHKIFKIIRTFATAGKVIVVGRAGSFITKDLPLGIHACLAAPRPFRVQNMVRVFGMRQGEAEAAVQDQDAVRALLVKKCFLNKDIGDPLNYDMVWNTERVPIAAIASFLVQRVNRKAGETKTAGQACRL